MDYNTLKGLADDGLSIAKIGIKTNKSCTAVRYWLIKFNIETNRSRELKIKLTDEEILSRKRKRSVIAVSNRRRKIKQMAVEYLGGSCERCGYKKCIGALDFHHKNKNEKSFLISGKGSCIAWVKIKNELDKCMLVCANCHREIHAEEDYLSNKNGLVA